MATNPQARILELLRRFNNGQKVCLESLKNDSMWEGKSEKTLRRDFDVIKEYFPESFELISGGDKGCYKAITKSAFSNFMDKETLALMVQTFNIAQKNNVLEGLNISADDKLIINAKIKKSKECYKFISKPYETKKGDVILFKEMERAIIYKRYITLIQQEGSTSTEYELKPYKIIFIHENFYLACENTNLEHSFSIFRISNIQKIKIHAKTFHTNLDIKSFIKEIQTPFPKYTPNYKIHMIEVLVEIDKEKANFFKLKKFLPSQKVMEIKDDGSILLSFKVTQEMEMEEIIKKWIPYMKVIKPLSLKKKIEDDLKKYLKNKF